MPEEPGVSQEAHGNYIAQATHGASATVNVYASPPSLSDQNRARFLVRLRTRYHDLLSQSLHGAVRMNLELAGHPDAVAPPVRLLYESDQQSAHPLTASTSFFQIYEDAGHELLVLGEPGAGKSTLLLKLACDLVMQAERDQSQGLPVMIPLSSWARKRQPFAQWLAEQIALLYDIALPLATRWVQEERLLLLLDGLDEMEEDARAPCIEAINTYHHAHLHPLVVGSRKTEYEAAATHALLALHSAVVVQSLTTEQVDTYLEQCGEPVAALRTALRENPGLQEVTTTPLMLSILILTYQGQAVSALPTTHSVLDQQQQIFSAYVERMVKRKATLTHSSPQDLVSWLSFLARQMREHNQTIFYLEHLQPDWLARGQQHRYEWLALRFPALLLGVLAGLTITSLLGYTDPDTLLRFAALGGLLGWLFSRPASSRERIPRPPKGLPWPLLLRHIAKGILAGIIFGLIFGGDLAGGFGLSYDPFFGVPIGLSSLLLSSLLPSPSFEQTTSTTRTTRRLSWLLNLLHTLHARRAICVIVVLGTGIGLSYALDYRLIYEPGYGLIALQPHFFWRRRGRERKDSPVFRLLHIGL